MAYGAILGQKTDLSKYADSIQLRKATYGDLPIGATVPLNVGETQYDWIVVQQGTPSDLYDNSCNGTWLMMKNCYNKKVWDSDNVSNYGTSDINNYLNSTFYNLFDRSTQSIIQEVKIPYVNNKVLTTSDVKVFLLSPLELNIPTGSPVPDGNVLSYFVNATDSDRIANLNNSPINWWSRSLSYSQPSTIYSIDSSGSFTLYFPNKNLGVRPAIIVQSTAFPLTQFYTLTLPDGTNITSEVRQVLGLT